MTPIIGGQSEEKKPKHILDLFKLYVGGTEVKIYKNSLLQDHCAFLSPELYEVVKTHFQKEADKTQEIKNAIVHNKSNKPIS